MNDRDLLAIYLKEVSISKSDRVCNECGLIHANGISWHGRCYKCGGDLIAFDFADHEKVAVTPAGLEIYYKKETI